MSLNVIFVNTVRKLGEKEIVVTAGDVNDRVESNAESHEDQHGSYDCRVGIKGGERIPDVFATMMNMRVRNAFFNKMRKLKDNWRKMWKLQEDNLKKDFR